MEPLDASVRKVMTGDGLFFEKSHLPGAHMHSGAIASTRPIYKATHLEAECDSVLAVQLHE